MRLRKLKDLDEDDILECLNCGHMDIAKAWKDLPTGECPYCHSRAFVVYEGTRKFPHKIR